MGDSYSRIAFYLCLSVEGWFFILRVSVEIANESFNPEDSMLDLLLIENLSLERGILLLELLVLVLQVSPVGDIVHAGLDLFQD